MTPGQKGELSREQLDSIRIEFDWDPGGHATALNWMNRRTGAARVMNLLIALFLVFRVMIPVVRDPTPVQIAGAIPWAAFGAAAWWFFSSGVGWLAARRLAKVDPHRTGPQVQRVGSQGLSIDWGMGELSVPWSGISKLVETDKYFFWYVNPETAEYTPKEALRTEEAEMLRQLIQANLSEEKLSLESR